ncbi:hypothetical protein C6501_14955 [Candidatus Poribacteria bacterium]|nr:MAG: hypothetical protein C6501_14955 [Candidatus Poribacteria bacterium]
MKYRIPILTILFSIFTCFFGVFISDASAGITVVLTPPSDYDRWIPEIPEDQKKITFTVVVSNLHTNADGTPNNVVTSQKMSL